MSRPGTLITTQDAAPSRTHPTNTATWFVTGLTEKGPLTPTRISSFAAFAATFGPRESYSILSDAVEVYFRDGGSEVVVTRVVGPAATVAKVDLLGATVATLRVSAIGPQTDNAPKVAVEAGAAAGTFVLVVQNADGVEVERSPDLVDKPAAISWSSASSYVRASDLAGLDNPIVVAAAPLAGGNDDRTSIVDADRVTALTLAGPDLGPGQVSVPGVSTIAVHEALLDHAVDRNRRAILDPADGLDDVALKALGSSLRALGTKARKGALFAPWYTVPGVTSTSTRDVPPSALVAAKCAQVDAAGNPNVAAAGDKGVSNYALSVKATFTDDERTALNSVGVNVIRDIDDAITVYGFRTLVDKLTDPLNWQLSNARLDMAVQAQAEDILARHLFAQLDGKGIETANYGGQLVAMLLRFYAVGALYGDTPDAAFRVDVGPTVNTPETIADGRLLANLSLVRSPFAESVELNIVKRSVSDGT